MIYTNSYFQRKYNLGTILSNISLLSYIFVSYYPVDLNLRPCCHPPHCNKFSYHNLFYWEDQELHITWCKIWKGTKIEIIFGKIHTPVDWDLVKCYMWFSIHQLTQCSLWKNTIFMKEKQLGFRLAFEVCLKILLSILNDIIQVHEDVTPSSL